MEQNRQRDTHNWTLRHSITSLVVFELVFVRPTMKIVPLRNGNDVLTAAPRRLDFASTPSSTRGSVPTSPLTRRQSIASIPLALRRQSMDIKTSPLTRRQSLATSTSSSQKLRRSINVATSPLARRQSLVVPSQHRLSINITSSPLLERRTILHPSTNHDTMDDATNPWSGSLPGFHLNTNVLYQYLSLEEWEDLEHDTTLMQETAITSNKAHVGGKEIDQLDDQNQGWRPTFMPLTDSTNQHEPTGLSQAVAKFKASGNLKSKTINAATRIKAKVSNMRSKIKSRATQRKKKAKIKLKLPKLLQTVSVLRAKIPAWTKRVVKVTLKVTDTNNVKVKNTPNQVTKMVTTNDQKRTSPELSSKQRPTLQSLPLDTNSKAGKHRQPIKSKNFDPTDQDLLLLLTTLRTSPLSKDATHPKSTSMQQSQWEGKYAKLEAYHKKHGHCRLSRQNHSMLYNWLSRQKYLLPSLYTLLQSNQKVDGENTDPHLSSRRNALEFRIKKLDRLGYNWRTNSSQL